MSNFILPHLHVSLHNLFNINSKSKFLVIFQQRTEWAERKHIVFLHSVLRKLRNCGKEKWKENWWTPCNFEGKTPGGLKTHKRRKHREKWIQKTEIMKSESFLPFIRPRCALHCSSGDYAMCCLRLLSDYLLFPQLVHL